MDGLESLRPGLGQDQVRAIAPEVGGGFGAKINIYGEEYVAAAVSKRLGIPVWKFGGA